MKIYLAGKITGDPDYKEKFASAARMLAEQEPGCVVLNPAELPAGMSQKDYMQLCTQMLFAADAAAFLPDWMCSRGACIEYEICVYIGKSVMMLGEDKRNFRTNEIKSA